MGRATLACILAAVLSLAARGGEEDCLPRLLDGGVRGDMMKRYLARHIAAAWRRWQEGYEKRTSLEAVAKHQKRLREKLLEALGGLPKRTPLNPQVTGTVERDGYRVEKVVFESQPKHFVTAALFLPAPERFEPPYPGVLVPCGHAIDGKGHLEYQTMGALLALHGMAALVFDPIDQGERGQILNEHGRPVIWGTHAHMMVGVACILLGHNTMRFELWDGMRAIDYLQSRDEVDGSRIGCTGNSGGGTQTAFLLALDDRVVAAAPSCYINRQGHQVQHATGDAEQNVWGQLAWGFEHADFLTVRAPTPVLICAATGDFFAIEETWRTFRYAKRLFTRFRAPERVSLMENDAPHNFNALQRQAAAHWMARWLLEKHPTVAEPGIDRLGEREILCTPRGQVMFLRDARSVYDLNDEAAAELAEPRRTLWAGTKRQALLDRVRAVAGIRKLDEIPEPEVKEVGVAERPGYRVERLILRPEEGIYLPAWLFTSARRLPGHAALYVSEGGKADDMAFVQERLDAGATVLAVDLRGTGETRQTQQGKFEGDFGYEWQDIFGAYVLGKSYAGMRAEDILVCARYLFQRASAVKAGGVQLVAVGSVGVPALHAAALEPQLFKGLRLKRTLTSWSDVLRSRLHRDQLVNAVHGALRVYDLPDLAGVLGDKLTVEEPVNAMGEVIRIE